jgi:transcriptional regulator with XRE-family HTH domain
LRELRNYTQEYVADELGISQNAYSLLENGKTAMRVEQLLVLAKVLDTDPNELLSPNPPVININNTDNTIENGGIFHGGLQHIYNDQRDEIAFLKTQLAEKDKQIQALTQLLARQGGNG